MGWQQGPKDIDGKTETRKEARRFNNQTPKHGYGESVPVAVCVCVGAPTASNAVPACSRSTSNTPNGKPIQQTAKQHAKTQTCLFDPVLRRSEHE